MFHVLSKILGFLTQPYVWIFLLLLVAFFGKANRRKRVLGISILLMYFFSNAFIVDELIRMWETDVTSKDQISIDTRTAVVLGGGLSYDEASDRVVFGGGADRYLQALEILNSNKVDRLLLSGGTGNMTGSDIREADLAKRFYMNSGVSEDRLLVERESRNTHENAAFSAKLIEGNSIPPRILLITSAFHMRRAQACFEKEGMIVQTYSTGNLALERKFNLEHIFVPHQRNLGK
jgi:uncharacterized SAM-binding protein YcdF (DUF218 family)